MLLQTRLTYWKLYLSLSDAGYARKKASFYAEQEVIVDELDFSEEACIQRYVTFAHFDENTEDFLHIEGIEDDEQIISYLQRYGRIAVDWQPYVTRQSAVTEDEAPHFGMAA